MNHAKRGMRTFGIVWLGQLVSLLGSSLTGFALGVWIYQGTGSVTHFALIVLCTALPTVLFSPLAGALVDRWDRRRIMLLSDTLAALSTLTIALLLFSGRLEVWHIYLATAINSTLAALQWPAYIAATTLLVPKRQLARASGMVQMSRALAQLAAPLLGALLLGAIGLKGIILLDFVTFFLGVVTLLSVRFPRPAASRDNEIQGGSLRREIAQAWTYIASRPGLLGLLLFFTGINLIVGMVQVLITPLVLSFASTVALGAILSSGGIGMVAGSVLMSLWEGPRRLMTAVFGFMLLGGLWLSVAGLSTSVFLLGMMAFAFFFGLPMINGYSQVIFQKKVAPEIQGRVFALNGALAGASLPLAYLLAGPLADYIFEPLLASGGLLAYGIGPFIGVGPGRGIGLLFIVLGILTMIVTLVAWHYPRLRRVEDELPDRVPAEAQPPYGQPEFSA